MTDETRIRYLKQLNHPEVERRKTAILKLSRTRDPHIYKILSGYFSESHPDIREILLQVFTRERSRGIAEIAADTLHSPQISVRSLAMHIIKEMGSEAVLPLRRLCKSSNAEVRRIAAELLGDIPDPAAARILMDMLEDTEERVVINVIKGLGNQKVIEAVPVLSELFESSQALKPIILSSMNKIFSHWENHLIQSDLLATDSILAFSYLTTLQETGNVTSLHLVMDWLEKDMLELGDEIIKALESILRKNPRLTLPGSFFIVLHKNWAKYSEDIPQMTYLNCLSRVPHLQALEILIEYYQNHEESETSLLPLVEFIHRFFGIFLLSSHDLDRRVRLKILQQLRNSDIPVNDPEIIRAYKQTKDEAEKKVLLEIAIQNRIPEAKDILLENLNNRGKTKMADILEQLLNFYDENLWSLYYKNLENSNQDARALALKGVLQYPHLLEKYILQKIPGARQQEQFFMLNLVFMMSPEDSISFLKHWLKEANAHQIELLADFFRENKIVEFLPLTVLSLLDQPAAATQLCSKLQEHIDSFHVTEKVSTYFKKVSPQAVHELRDFMLRYWEGTALKFLQNIHLTYIPGKRDYPDTSTMIAAS